jgi:4a-hydroxytetrahydrobiopterin dehydratase
MSLSSERCIPCRGDIAPLTIEEAQEYLSEMPSWSLIDNSSKIRRNFRFEDFLSALEFVQKISALAEEQGHHPDISFGWGYCSVIFYTHKIAGLHKNDFIMAAKVNALYVESTPGEAKKKRGG